MLIFFTQLYEKSEFYKNYESKFFFHMGLVTSAQQIVFIA